MVQLVERALGKHWDLGSIPRSPPFLNIFWLNVIPCNTHPRAYHAASCLYLPRVSKDESKGQYRISIMGISQTCHSHPRKVKGASFKWAKSAGKYLQIGVNTPHWFALYFFILFIFSILFVLLSFISIL